MFFNIVARFRDFFQEKCWFARYIFCARYFAQPKSFNYSLNEDRFYSITSLTHYKCTRATTSLVKPV